MAEPVKKKSEDQPILNSSALNIVKVEDSSVIVLVDGWRMRVYSDQELDKNSYGVGQSIEVKYYGNLDDVHSLRFEKLK